MKEKTRQACKELLKKIQAGHIINQNELEKEKVIISKKYLLDHVIRNSDISSLTKNRKIKNLLKTKPVRTLSGVANIAVMWKGDCPGSCIYCPKGKRKDSKGVMHFVPKSYTGSEPATLRAIRTDYNPYKQVENRLKQLKSIGHPTDKCELIIMGGTFLSWSRKNQIFFIKQCLDAFNEKKSKTLKQAQKINEKAKHRCIGLTIETRADYCTQSDINWMLRLGCTRVEIGVQTTSNKILKKINRGHGTKENIAAIKRLKQAGLKVCIHWMPGLTGLQKLDMKKETEMFKQLFKSDYQPDELKIYPTLVIEGTKLYEMWKKHKYKPLTIDQMTHLMLELKKLVPEYVRIKRIMRDISEKGVVAGPKTTNLRQLVNERMIKNGISCKCIRCREVGLSKNKPEKIELRKIEYKASGGKEIFLSFEDKKNRILLAFLRLRIDTDKIAKVRELHVYGPMIEIGKRGAYQHIGYGKKLLSEAEKIARSLKINRIQVTSGIGVRNYYKNLGYKLKNNYMTKALN